MENITNMEIIKCLVGSSAIDNRRVESAEAARPLQSSLSSFVLFRPACEQDSEFEDWSVATGTVHLNGFSRQISSLATAEIAAVLSET
jgi:hypothetical protein